MCRPNRGRSNPEYPRAFEGADLVIFDSSRKFLTVTGLEENSADHFDRFMTALIDPLMQAGITTVVLDNTGHAEHDRSRGTSAKEDLADVVYSFKQLREFGLDRAGEAHLTVTHSRLGELTGTWQLALGGGHYGRWEHMDGSMARAAFERTCIAALEEKRPLGRDALIAAVRDRGARVTDATWRDWLGEFVADRFSPIAHSNEGYDLVSQTWADAPPRSAQVTRLETRGGDLGADPPPTGVMVRPPRSGKPPTTGRTRAQP